MTKFLYYCLWKIRTQTAQVNRLLQTFCLFLIFMVVVQLPLSQPDFSPHYEALAPFILFSAGFFIACLPLSAYFEEDIKDGTIDHIIADQALYPYSLALYSTYVLFYIFPLVLILGAIAFINGFDSTLILILMGSFFLSSFILLGWGGIAAMLTTSQAKSSLLAPLTLIPLGIPSLLISQATLCAATQGLPTNSYFSIHAGLALITAGISLGFTPTIIRNLN